MGLKMKKEKYEKILGSKSVVGFLFFFPPTASPPESELFVDSPDLEEEKSEVEC